MVGGDAAALERALPALDAIGDPEKRVHCGEVGLGLVAKLVKQPAGRGDLRPAPPRRWASASAPASTGHHPRGRDARQRRLVAAAQPVSEGAAR